MVRVDAAGFTAAWPNNVDRLAILVGRGQPEPRTFHKLYVVEVLEGLNVLDQGVGKLVYRNGSELAIFDHQPLVFIVSSLPAHAQLSSQNSSLIQLYRVSQAKRQFRRKNAFLPNAY